MNRAVKKLIFAVIILVVAGATDYIRKQTGSNNTSISSQQNTTASSQNKQQTLKKIRAAAKSQKSGWWLESNATVIKLLRDDTKGHQHQKFLVKLAPDITLLVAHNLDLADRAPIKKGDSINIRARYEWNNRGGVLHWTHHDPKGRQKGGWIELNGKRYK